MKKHSLKIFVPGIFAATALVLAAGASARSTPPDETPPVTAKAPASPMGGHHGRMESAEKLEHRADMQAECQAMMAKKQEMRDTLKKMDAELDKLVTEMNAAKESKAPDALEKSMAAVINALVAEQKASRAMMMDMQPAMMQHMTHHMEMRGTGKAMGCPMMKTGDAAEPEPEDTKPKM
jgi:hypothetical protein